MLLKLTTLEGPVIVNADDIHAVVPYAGETEEAHGSDIWWKDHVKDPVGSGINHRSRTTYVEESLDRIMALLRGAKG